ncbi:TetR family transcriptional regulator [Arthrobacter castelli]|uniref:TetR family transcriptional regulator n=1 Tax=Arthrobacter castelli TaxID=271431 RepID=UPI0004131FEA|nr:TetR family transcriptional regulator [Arthrobacter castelli]
MTTRSSDTEGVTAESVAPSRREMNKQANRRAMADAAIELVRSRGAGNFTADDVAAAAGVSRRTFFNYFPSPESALAVHIEDFLDNVLPYFHQRPTGEPVVESMLQALTELADPALLERTAELFQLAEDNPQMHRFQLEAWTRAEYKIVDAIDDRLDPADPARQHPLFVPALVGSVFASARAALSEWLRRTGGDLSPASLSGLRELLIAAFGHLRSGFHN